MLDVRVPEELKAVNQWHCWKLIGDTKIPCKIDGKAAKSNDPSTWVDFQTALDYATFHGGLAFEITDPWCGIDLDDCIDENGLKPWAIEILFRFDGVGFAEVSPSGTGIKILTRGRKPEGSRCTHKFDEGQVECYDNRRFWTITGDIYNGQDEIGDGQDAIDWLCERFLSKQKKPSEQPMPMHVPPEVYLPRLPADNLQKRAAAYVAIVPGEPEGGRNNAAFRLAGQLFAFVGDNGERLEDHFIADLLREWNQKNSVPLPDHELMSAGSSAKRNGTAREDKPPQQMTERTYLNVDLSRMLDNSEDSDIDDNEFCQQAVPPLGLLRDIYEYYWLTSHRKSHIMGLAVAVSVCETIFGRRISSHTNLRTNDYNVVIAQTNAGKEACETAVSAILSAADISKMPMIPPDVQSGNGLLKAIADAKCGIWVCDEFGKVLESILDRKNNNGHAKQIGTHLLKLYGKAAGLYGGAAHADGVRNQIVQPHLCLLGMTTGLMFEAIDSRQVQDGLFGRIAFWPVQNRPKRITSRFHPVPDSLASQVRQWLHWEPVGVNPDYPRPEVLEMTPDALARWEHHAECIDEKMEHEMESRAAIWGRVAARAMKLSLVHRAARVGDDPGKVDWTFSRIELIDVEWGIMLANWLARVACGLIQEKIVDIQATRVTAILHHAVIELKRVSKFDLLRQFRTICASEINAAAEILEAEGKITIEKEPTGRRPKTYYLLPKTTEQ